MFQSEQNTMSSASLALEPHSRCTTGDVTGCAGCWSSLCASTSWGLGDNQSLTILFYAEADCLKIGWHFV